jgi:hypothetical protein
MKRSTYTYFVLISLFFAIDNPIIGQNIGDCINAFPITAYNKYEFVDIVGQGEDRSEANNVPCFYNGDSKGNAELNSVWMSFEIQEAGTIYFVISPNSRYDDIDFVLFELGKNKTCESKKIIRCMAAGTKTDNITDNTDNQNSDNKENSMDEFYRCMGKTGLANREQDKFTDAGCEDRNDNNWLKPLEAEKGKNYVLLVNNITNYESGFNIIFSGDAVFATPEKTKSE